jgi:hypothetical protein
VDGGCERASVDRAARCVQQQRLNMVVDSSDSKDLCEAGFAFFLVRTAHKEDSFSIYFCSSSFVAIE